MQAQIIIALSRIIEADFKTALNKFQEQGVDDDVIKDTFEAFKEAKKKNKIKENDQKNIDWWAKKPWDEFKAFVDEVTESLTKGDEVRYKANKGAELRAEDDNWVVYKMLSQEGCVFYGTNRWCISKEGSSHYDSYSKQNDFYFALSKDQNKDDKWNKIAVQVDNLTGNILNYWDTTDTSHKALPETIELPEFEIDKTDLEGIKEKLEPDFKIIRRLMKKVARSYVIDYSNKHNAKLVYEDGDMGNRTFFSGNLTHPGSQPVFDVKIRVGGGGGGIRLVINSHLKNFQAIEDNYSLEDFKRQLEQFTYRYLAKD